MDKSPRGRSSQLVAGRTLLAAGRPAAARRQIWKAVHGAVKRGDRETLEEAARLANSLDGATDGKEREQAHVLLRYVEGCLADLDAGDGERTRSLLRLRAPAKSAVKICPDCAETVKAAARVCRFCGFRFAPPPGPDPG